MEAVRLNKLTGTAALAVAVGYVYTLSKNTATCLVFTGIPGDGLPPRLLLPVHV